MTTSRKLILKFRAPHQDTYKERPLKVYDGPGTGQKLRLVVITGDIPSGGIRVPKGHYLAGATVLRLEEGTEFEVWEEP
jgi:hypothetical protein